MAIERITQKIKADADAQAQQIAREAEGTIEGLRTEHAKTVSGIGQEAEDNAAGAARDQRMRLISRAQAEMRKELLEEKQKLIEQAFQQALDGFLALDDARYGALMKKLLLQAVEGGDEEVIIAAPDQKRNWTAILAEVNAELLTGGRTGRLVLSPETRSMVGGFVLRKGKKEINCNVTYLLKSLREELETEVAGILFATTGATGG